MEQIKFSLVEQLTDFFQQWPQNVVWSREAEKRSINIDLEQLAEFFSKLPEPLQSVQHRSLFFDPWEVAGLGRKEVRNTAVLAWLIDPSESHGLGKLPLKVLLRLIRNCGRNDIPEDFNHYCRVQVETSPSGDNTNRVDIEIDADNFFLIIEVKIDAYEQENQISDYCSEAKKRAGMRPWGVVFLTPDGRRSLTGSNEFRLEDVSCLSWHHLSVNLASSLQAYYRHLFSTENPSPIRQTAAHAAFCFIERMHQF